MPEESVSGTKNDFHRGEFEGTVNAKLESIEKGLDAILKNQSDMWKEINKNSLAVSNQRTVNTMLAGFVSIVVTFVARWIGK